MTPTIRRRVAAAVALLALVPLLSAPTSPVAQAASTDLVARHRSEAGALGPMTVIGDSVLNGSLYEWWGTTLDDHLVNHGWGPIRVRSGVGMQAHTAKAGSGADQWIDQWQAEGWDPPAVFVNLGANNPCGGDSECAYQQIMYVVDAIGPGHRIWWPKISFHPAVDYVRIAWNSALDRVAAEQPEFYTWDWPTVMATGNFATTDFIHLDPAGYRRRSAMMAAEATADLARSRREGQVGALPTPADAPSEFVPLTSTRVLDTRLSGPSPVGPGGEVTVDVADVVPAGATAVAVYVSATGTAAPGFVTAYECGTPRPTASSANYAAGQTRGALTIVPISPDGTVCLFTHAAADLLADVQGAFVGEGGVRFTPVDPPQRLADTRQSGRRSPLVIAAPPGAEALALNVTAVAGSEAGYLVAYPCGTTPPLSATVNYLAGDVVAGAAFVPVGTDGTVCVHSSSAAADVVVDRTGDFTDGSGLAFVPAAPTRTIDTRDGTGGWFPIHGGTQTVQAPTAPAGALAVSGTLTINAPLRSGFLTAAACGGPTPATSSVNAPAGATFANFVTTGLTGGQLCVYALSAGQTVFDTTGWWVPG